MAKEKICGIYCIENLVNHKKYIGSSIDIYSRWKQHKTSLKGNKHHSKRLNNSWNYYGEDNFKFYIIEKCSKENLIVREQFYIDLYQSYNNNNGYNVQPIAGRSIYDGISIEDLKNEKCKISYQQYLDINYFLCNTDLPILEISNIISVNDQILYKIYYGKLYKNIFNSNLFVKRNCINGEKHYNSVINEDMARNIIELLKQGFTNLETANKLNVNVGIVCDIRNHHSWKHLTEEIVFPPSKFIRPNKCKQINQYDLNNNYINTFKSLKEAMLYLNITSSGNLCSALKGKRETAYGFIWKYV